MLLHNIFLQRMVLMKCVPAVLLVLQAGAAVQQYDRCDATSVRAGQLCLQSLAAEADWLLLLQEN